MVTEARTEHPHIVVAGGPGGNQAVVKGTRLSVALIAALFNRGESPAGLLSMYPNLAPGALYDALSYYFDHKGDMDRDIEAADLDQLITQLRKDPEMEEIRPGLFRGKKPFGNRA